MRHTIVISLILLLLSACQELDILGMIVPCAYNEEERFAQSMAYNAEKGDLVLHVPTENYHINVAGDLHLVDNTARLDSFLYATRQHPLTACNLFIGDLVSDKKAYPLLHESLQQHYQMGGDTVFTMAGNHDVYYDAWPLYLKYFGSSIYTVSVQTPQARDLIICLESITSTLGRSQSKWLLKVLEELRPLYRYCFVATHANFFDTDNSNLFGSNPPLSEVMRLMDLFQQHRVNVCVQAHDHRAEHIYFKDVQYVQTNPLKMNTEPHGYVQIQVDSLSFKTEIIGSLLPRV